MSKKPFNKSVGGIALVVLLAVGNHFYPEVFSKLQGSSSSSTDNPSGQSLGQDGQEDQEGLSALKRAVAKQQSKVWFNETRFEIVKRLSDDTEGSQHQRLLVKREGLPTLLVAHNIDLAKRVPAKEGQTIWIKGRYEWNEKGGVIHWTHHDPQGNNPGGWIKFDNKKYY